MINVALAGLLARTLLLWAPPAQTTVSEWADSHRYLSSESSRSAGRWHTRVYQREPMDACSDPAVYRVIICSATQMLKTEVILNFLGWMVDVDPGPTLLLCHRNEDVRDFVEQRIDPMVRETPRLNGKVWGRRKAKKHFRGGFLDIKSGGSPSNVASTARKYVLFEEANKYVKSVGDEGNVVSLARNRLDSYEGRAKEISSCSPTYEGSQIDRDYQISDRREFLVKCPLCGEFQTMMRKYRTQVRFNTELPTFEEQAATARYHCEHCDAGWDDEQRSAAVEAGHWKPQAEFNGIAGFWISALYNQTKKLSAIVLEFLQKTAGGDQEELKAFVNTRLAENWAEQGDTPDWQLLAQRREQYAADVPKGALVLTAGADVHPDRIEVEIIGHGRQREKWSIRKEIFEGRTTEMVGQPGYPSPWEQLDAFLAEVYTHELGGDIGVTLLAIDSGNQSQDVYRWVRTQPPSRVVAIKGEDKGSLAVSEPRPVDVNLLGRKIKHGLRIRHVVGPFFKEQLYAGLKKQAPTSEQLAQGWKYPAGFCHFPEAKNYSDEYFRQLCAEELRTVKDKRGRTRREWAQLRARNEVLDCWVYAMGAAYILGLERYQERHWKELEHRLTADLFAKESAALPTVQVSAELTPPASETWESRDVTAPVNRGSSAPGGGWIPRRSNWFAR